MPRLLQLLLCLMALGWAAAARAIGQRAALGLGGRFGVAAAADLLSSCFFLFLLVVGLAALDRLATGGRFLDDILPLPKRPNRGREWGVGAAVGWGVALSAVLPLVLTRHLHGSVSHAGAFWLGGLFSLCSLAALTLGVEAAFRGYALARLTQAAGPATAAVLLALVFGTAMLLADPPLHVWLPLTSSVLLGGLLTLAVRRTHALWLGWGVHFALRAVLAVVLGLPLAGQAVLVSPVTLRAHGPRLLTGGSFGPMASVAAVLALLTGFVVLYRVTRDLAWQFAYTPAAAGGYAVTIAPPAAHAAMEQAVAPPPPLVQILPATPTSASAIDLPGGGLPRG